MQACSLRFMQHCHSSVCSGGKAVRLFQTLGNAMRSRVLPLEGLRKTCILLLLTCMGGTRAHQDADAKAREFVACAARDLIIISRFSQLFRANPTFTPLEN